jgi:hypothetical protein
MSPVFLKAPKHGTTTPHRGGRRGQPERMSASPSLVASETTSDIATKQSIMGTIMTQLTEVYTRLASLEDTRPRHRSRTGRNVPLGLHDAPLSI